MAIIVSLEDTADSQLNIKSAVDRTDIDNRDVNF